MVNEFRWYIQPFWYNIVHACDGQMDRRQTDGRNSWARTRGAQLSAGYTVNTHRMVARYAPHILISPAPHTTAAFSSVDLFIARTAEWHSDKRQTDRHEAKVGLQYLAESWELAWHIRAIAHAVARNKTVNWLVKSGQRNSLRLFRQKYWTKAYAH